MYRQGVVAGFIPDSKPARILLRAGIRPTFGNWGRWVIQLCWKSRPYFVPECLGMALNQHCLSQVGLRFFINPRLIFERDPG